MQKFPAFGGAALLCLVVTLADAQTIDTLSGVKAVNLPNKVFSAIQRKSAQLDQALQGQTTQYLQSLSQQDARLCNQLAKTDSGSAARLSANSAASYQGWITKISNVGAAGKLASPSGAYAPGIDSIKILLDFLNKNPQLLQSSAQTARLQSATTSFSQLCSRLQVADQVKQWLQSRRNQMGQALGPLGQVSGLQNAYNAYSQKAFYYSQQVQQLRQTFNDPDKLLQLSLTVMNRIPVFQRFAKQSGMLGGMFGPPAGYGSSTAVAGLQTKGQVSDQIQKQVAAGGPGGGAALQGNLQTAESQLDGFKNRLSQLGAGSGDIQMPAGFQPNPNKTKTFLRRLEVGFNFQTTQTNYYYPTISDLGISLGYKLGGSNLVAVGASYKIGWGNGIQHIVLSSQGVGLRASLQIKLKGSFSVTGGFEYNYTTPFVALQQLRQMQYWTKIGLIGVTKTISLKNRFFKKTTLSLLWDFLSYQQVPQTQPLLFRIGYAL
jgi:hypothetical protein